MAKSGEVQASVQGSRMEMIALSAIAPSETNPRKNFKEAELQELAASVKQKGVLQPVLVRPFPWRWGWQEHNHKRGVFTTVMLKGEGAGMTTRYAGEDFATQAAAVKAAEALGAKLPKFELIAGERRYRASKIAGLVEIPAVISDLDDKAVLEAQMVENLQRADLEPLEEAKGYQVLMTGHGYTAETLADKLHKSRSYVYGMIKLCGLPENAQQALETGLIPKSTAELIARLPNEKMRQKFANEVLKPEWDKSLMSYRKAKDIQEKSYMVELKGSPFPQQDPELLPAAGPCSSCPKMTGNARELFPDGRADMCTDPVCFGQKKTAHHARLVSKAQAAGLEVLDVKTSNKLFSPWTDTMQDTTHFLDLAEVCHRDKAKNARSFKQLLEGSGVKPVIAFDKKGKERKLVPRPAAEEWLKKTHKIELQQVQQSSAADSGAARLAAQKREEEQRKIRMLARVRVMDKVRGYKWKLDRKSLELLMPALIDTEAWHLDGLAPRQAAGGTAKALVNAKVCAMDYLRGRVKAAKTDSAILGEYFAAAVYAGLHPFVNGYKDDREHTGKIIAAVGLDLKAVVNEARLELVNEKPAKSARPAHKGKAKGAK